MSKALRTVRQCLFELFDQFMKIEKLYSETGIVISVDKSKLICTVKTYLNNTEISNVRISTHEVLSGTEKIGTQIFPKVGSDVIITYLDDRDHSFLSKIREIDEVKTYIDGKLHIENKTENLGLIISDFLDKLKAANIVTPAGAATFAPQTIVDLEAIKTRFKTIIE